MKVWKLVSGILSIIFFTIVTFQSCTVGVVNTIEANGGSSGSSGLFIAFLMLAGGIVSIASRNSSKKGGNIALIVLFGLAALVGFSTNSEIYQDIVVWAGWCLINVVIAIIALFTGKKNSEPQKMEQKNESNSGTDEGYKFCPHCGTKLPANSNFCTGCGEKV